MAAAAAFAPVAAAAPEVFGLAIGVLCLYEMLKGLFATPADQITTVRVFLGQTGTISTSLGGNVPGISLWDRYGNSIGSANGKKDKLPQGNFHDIKVAANKQIGNVPAHYISVTNGGDDAICVSYLTISYPDGSQASFTGDIGYLCGAPWFESELQMGINGETPKCMWIGRKPEPGQNTPQGFGFHVPDFINNKAQAAAYSKDNDLMCKSGPRFRIYDQLRTEDSILVFSPELKYNPDGTDVDTKLIIGNPGVPAAKVHNRRDIEDDSTGEEKRYVAFPHGDHHLKGDLTRRVVSNGTLYSNSTAPAQTPFEGKLVVSHVKHHSAKELCASEISLGPDFVAIEEGSFCDMESKILFGLCTPEKTTCCFDVEQSKLRPCMGRNRVRSGATVGVSDEAAVKDYHTVQEWGVEK